jgi:hypothetical protein
MKGMYWSWQSGFINFKLEGKSNICNTRNHVFQFHIGGYIFPYNTIQHIILPVQNKTNINVKLNIKKLLSQIDLKNVNQVMSPSEKSVEKIVFRNFNGNERIRIFKELFKKYLTHEYNKNVQRH